jgi:hypothetical protein
MITDANPAMDAAIAQIYSQTKHLHCIWHIGQNIPKNLKSKLHGNYEEFAKKFSNRPSSLMSSLGFYVTADTYFGHNGYSLKLEGLENGINDNASRRAVVVHGADYVNESLIQSQGYIGRSLGCPAISSEESGTVINTIKDGTCLFIYSPDKAYQQHSSLLN